jgi:hypothetical protein
MLAETLGITEFVNADVIARGLSGFDSDQMGYRLVAFGRAGGRAVIKDRQTWERITAI